MELDMKKEISSNDKISELTLHEILLDIKYRLDHLEDMEADNRALMVKLVKQNNSVVKFLASIDIEPIDSPFENMQLPSIDKPIKSGKITDLRELIDEFMSKQKDLKEFEKELKKYKGMITPGQIGET